jgi:hypothetical protein
MCGLLLSVTFETMKRILFIVGTLLALLTSCSKRDVRTNKKIDGEWKATTFREGDMDEVLAEEENTNRLDHFIASFEFSADDDKNTGTLIWVDERIHSQGTHSSGHIYTVESTYEIQQNGEHMYWYISELDCNLSLSLTDKNKTMELKGWCSEEGINENYLWIILEKK